MSALLGNRTVRETLFGDDDDSLKVGPYLTINLTAISMKTGVTILDSANSYGTNGYVLQSTGNGVVWSPAVPATNTQAQYTWTNTHIHQANVTYTNASVSFQSNVTFQANVTYSNAVIIANGAFGSNTQVLMSNGTGMFWGAVAGNAGGTVTQVQSGSGLTGGPITATGTLSVIANTGIVANATAVYVNSAYITSLNPVNTSATYAWTNNHTYSLNVAVGSTNTGFAKFYVNSVDSTMSFGAAGNTKGVRIYSTVGGTIIEGVDQTLSGSYQPLFIGGSQLNFTIAGTTYAALNSTAVFIANTVGIYANSSFGTNGQFLASNGTTAYWTTTPNTAAQFTWTNTHTYSANVTFSANVSVTKIVANGTVGTNAQVLTVNSSGGVYWGDVSSSNNVTKVYTKLTATANQNTFSSSSTFANGFIDVYYNGSHLNTSDYSVINSTAIQLTSNAVLNDIIEIVAFQNITIPSSGVVKGYDKFTATANQNTFTVAASYSSGYIDIYRNGVHLSTSDYAEVNSTAFQLTSNASLNDVIEAVSLRIFSATLPGGSNTYVQINDSGVINGTAGFTFDKSTNTATVPALVTNSVTAAANLVLKTANTTAGAVVNILANGGIAISGNSSANAFTISSAGIPNFPYKPAFFTYGSGTQNMSGTQTVNKLLANTSQAIGANKSSGWSSANNKFTAPVAGTYYIFAKFVPSAASSSGPALILYKNGVSAIEMAIDYVNISYCTASGEVMIDLAASDYLEMYLSNYNNTTIQVDLGRCWWGGFLVG